MRTYHACIATALTVVLVICAVEAMSAIAILVLTLAAMFWAVGAAWCWALWIADRQDREV